jgi:hypothetical protein
MGMGIRVHPMFVLIGTPIRCDCRTAVVKIFTGAAQKKPLNADGGSSVAIRAGRLREHPSFLPTAEKGRNERAIQAKPQAEIIPPR